MWSSLPISRFVRWNYKVIFTYYFAQPPKNLLIEVRVLEKCGIIQTENGPISLDFGSVHFLRRSEVEHLIRDGKVEHVVNDDHC
jgi:hypothetical protein